MTARFFQPIPPTSYVLNNSLCHDGKIKVITKLFFGSSKVPLTCFLFVYLFVLFPCLLVLLAVKYIVLSYGSVGSTYLSENVAFN